MKKKRKGDQQRKMGVKGQGLFQRLNQLRHSKRGPRVLPISSKVGKVQKHSRKSEVIREKDMGGSKTPPVGKTTSDKLVVTL